MSRTPTGWTGFWVAACLVASGCLGSTEPDASAAESGAGKPPVAPTGDAPAPTATTDTGAIAVTATTSDVEPVPAAQVLLSGTERSEFTDAAGRATFNDLEPGKYTVLVSKPGYRAKQEGGRLLEVFAGMVSETKLVLDPVVVITEATSYQRTIPFRGFMACSAYVALVASAEHCGRGVTYGGTTYLRDPNDNTTHAWSIEGPQVRGWVLEATWQSTFPLSSPMLYFIQAGSAACNPNCVYSKSFGGRGQAAPFRWQTNEGEGKNITKVLGEDVKLYPHSMVTHVRAFCSPSPCASFTWQQAYNAWTNVFYGQEVPDGFSGLP